MNWKKLEENLGKVIELCIPFVIIILCFGCCILVGDTVEHNERMARDAEGSVVKMASGYNTCLDSTKWIEVCEERNVSCDEEFKEQWCSENWEKYSGEEDG